MTVPADRIYTNAAIHQLTRTSIRNDPATPDAQAIAVRDGRIVAVGSESAVFDHSVGDTTIVDLNDSVVVPGLIDAHTHMLQEGLTIIHADLSQATSRSEAVELLTTQADSHEGAWVIGVGFDESTWPEQRPLTREDLDRVSTERPVAAVRVDMHTAAVNSVVLEEYQSEMADRHVKVAGNEPTGVIVEDALDVIKPVKDPGVERSRDLLEAAVDRALARGITGVHDKVRHSAAPRVYRELDLQDKLPVRVRIDYWRDHLDALTELGARTNHGSEMVTVGGVKTFTDGAIGGRTARVSTAYQDADDTHPYGQWVVDPETYRKTVFEVDKAGLQMVTHAIGDEAIDLVVDTYTNTTGTRHRIEHVELASDLAIEQLANDGIVASVQPNFHRWAQPGGLYDQAIGERRRKKTNRLGRMHDAGVRLAFGSDGMPMDPLVGLEHAVSAPTQEQRLSVTAALRAYTYGSAYAGYDEDRLGTIEPGKHADFVVLDESPWKIAPEITDLSVRATIVDGIPRYSDNERKA